MEIVGLYAGLLTLVYLALCYKIVSFRKKYQVGIGDGGHEDLSRALRVQGNFMEYVPLALILLLILANHRPDSWLLHGAGALLVIARLLHATGLGRSSGRSFGRFWGTFITWLLLLLLSILNMVFIILE